MKIDILTIFPGMFTGPLSESILARAQTKGLVNLKVHDLRQWTNDERRTVDDRPYGGGPGMVMLVEPIDKALTDIRRLTNYPINRCRTILTSPRGTTFTQAKARELAQFDHLIFIAGHYEGVDQRVTDHLIDEEISIGDYVLTGGELPTMVMVDSVVRLIPGVLGDPESTTEESHSVPGFIEYPHYTRPENYKDWPVPPILLSGNHAEIKKWRQSQSQIKS